jgi:hypothetical protein
VKGIILESSIAFNPCCGRDKAFIWGVNTTPLRIVPYSSELKDRLFGPRPIMASRSNCRTVFAIDLANGHLLYFALTDDFEFVLDHRDEILFSDGQNVIVEEIPADTSFDDEIQFHSVAGLKRLKECKDTIEDDFHKFGGDSLWLTENPKPGFSLVAQLAFPNHLDLLLSLDWPTGEYTVEILYQTSKKAYCAVWRMHA